MARVKKEYDAEGVKLTMRTRDYLADMSGQLALGIMADYRQIQSELQAREEGKA